MKYLIAIVKQIKNPAHQLVLVIFLLISIHSFAQELYTARSYWEEATKETYRKLKQKQDVGDSLSNNETTYLQDYETFLDSYYKRLSDAEKVKYEQMKDQWDRELQVAPEPKIVKEEFEWKPRDRFMNSLYGIWYGTSLVIVADIDNAAAAGIPLITGGLWLLGPVLNPKKYEGITRSTVRASNTGKFLGLFYGGALGTMLAGESDEPAKLVFGLSTVGSIALGEIGFQLQKKRNYSDGHIEMMRHYGVLGPWVGVSLFESADVDNINLAGASLLAGGVVGLITGNFVSKRYDYTRGDVDAISSLSWISTALGFTIMAESFDNNNTSSLFLIPAAGSILGTVLGQKAVKGAHLTKKQGSTITLSTGGAALIGLGVATLLESESATAWIGIPSGLALITHQVLFYIYKRDNILERMEGRNRRNHNFHFSMNIMPENYFINKQLPIRESSPHTNSPAANPLVKLKLTF